MHAVLYSLNADYAAGAATLDRCGGPVAVCEALCAVVYAQSVDNEQGSALARLESVVRSG